MEKQDLLEPDCFYHIFNRGNNKENLFIENENYLYFLKLIKTHLLSIAEIYSYCLMKNHFHLVLKIKSKEEIEKKLSVDKIHQPFSNLFNAYTKAINKKYNREGSLFKVRFKRERIESEEYLRNVIVYVHLNPVKHKFQENYIDYKYSSYNSILSDKPTLLLRNDVLELFGGKENYIYHHREIFLKGNYEDFE
jgi:putative transposase